MSNPNKNDLSVLITAPSYTKPVPVTIRNIHGNIKIDLTPCNPCTPCPNEGCYINIDGNNELKDVNITKTFAPGSQFTQISTSSILDSSQPYQIVKYYNINNNIIDNSNLLLINKIEANYNNMQSYNVEDPYNYLLPAIIVGIILGILALLGVGYNIIYSNKKKIIHFHPH